MDTDQITELPLPLQPTVTFADLTKEEQGEWDALQRWAAQQEAGESGKHAFLLFVNQRRATRAWTVGCALTAGGLGLLMGYLAWGRR